MADEGSENWQDFLCAQRAKQDAFYRTEGWLPPEEAQALREQLVSSERAVANYDANYTIDINARLERDALREEAEKLRAQLDVYHRLGPPTAVPGPLAPDLARRLVEAAEDVRAWFFGERDHEHDTPPEQRMEKLAKALAEAKVALLGDGNAKALK